MASPQRMAPRARRQAAARGTALRQQWAEEEDVEVEVEQEEQEEEEAPRRRRAGKAPVGEEEDYDPLEDEGGEELEEAAGASRRRGRGGDDAGPSQKRGRRGVAVKREMGGDDQPGPSRRAAAAAAGGGAHASAGELRRMEEKIAEYNNLRTAAADKASGKAPRMALEHAARAVVRYMLFAHAEKPGVPVKRSELATIISQRLPNVKSKAVVSACVIAHAQHYLIDAMGLEMCQVNKLAARRQELAGNADEGSQQFVLRSTVPSQLRLAFVQDRGQDAQRGLLMVVLALVHLGGGKLEEEDLLTQLEELGIPRDAPHPVFGRTPELLKLFCTRRYIQTDKQAGPDGEVVTYRFAEQAVGQQAEIGEAKIQEFIDAQFNNN